MVFTVREAYGEVSVGEAPGGNFFQTASPDPLWRGPGKHFSGFCADFERFWVPFGSLFGFICMQKGSPKVRPKKHRNRATKMEGPAAGAGSL